MNAEVSFDRAIGSVPRQAERVDKERLIATLTLAFAADPPVRWMYPDPQTYLRNFPAFVDAFGGAALTTGTAFYADDFSGCALWLPPGEGADEAALAQLVERSVAEPRRQEVFSLFAAMERSHPKEAHWYLPLIGVEPAAQGRGIGSALLEATLSECDRAGLPAYLEATSPRNVPLYERHGFRRLPCIQVGTCPPITPMRRIPRG